MHLRYTPAEEAFRDELRAWLRRTVPAMSPAPPDDDWPARRVHDATWQRTLFDAGYAGIHWPVEAGGRGASPVQHLIFVEECERAGAPYAPTTFIGLNHAGPTIAAEGTAEQRRRFLPSILRGDAIWCQGFSEPDAGSDLAALSTTAVRDGDEYVLNGQKLWTSYSPIADYCEILVRTGPGTSRHRGISWLAMPMDAPGIEVRPIKTITGTGEFAEMFLNDVRVPCTNRIGAEDDGWRIAMVTLGFERGATFVADLIGSKVLLAELAASARSGARPAWHDDGLRREIGQLSAELEGLWALARYNVCTAARGGPPTQGASILKLRYTELRQRLFELAGRLLGPGSLALSDIGHLPNGRLVKERLQGLSHTIAAGTSQIQRNILAERFLGLPKG